MSNKTLRTAQTSKMDEFYTQLKDIEDEVRLYSDYFRGKTVYCNCDDPFKSNFFKYFESHFKELGLKRLIATCYNGKLEGDLFADFEDTGRQAFHTEVTEEGRVDSLLKGNGDFASKECRDLLSESDFVVTNPPFSLFRRFMSVLSKSKVKFLILGNVNGLAYKNVFPFFIRQEIWFGEHFHKGDVLFNTPPEYGEYACKAGFDENGNRRVRVTGIRWFTNIGHRKNPPPLELTEHYSPDVYPHYENFDAINVDRTKEIPCDYFETIGVPITFYDKWNSNQFEIVGIAKRGADGFSPFSKVYTKEDSEDYMHLNAGPVLNIDGELQTLYLRLLIRRKKNFQK